MSLAEKAGQTLAITLYVLSLIGWLMNLNMFIKATSHSTTNKMLLRGAGVVVYPFGAVEGYFTFK